MIAERDVQVGGVRLHAAESGAGDPPFILLHGLGWESAVWHEALPRLASARRAIALDLPGHGASDAPDGPYSPQWLAGSVRAFMDAQGIDRAILVGNSLGGLTAIALAAAWPERVEALAAVNPALPNEGAPSDRRTILNYAAIVAPGIGRLYVERQWGRDPALIVEERIALNFVDPARLSEDIRLRLLEDAQRRGRSPELLRALRRATRSLVWTLTARRERTWSWVRALRVPTVFIWGEGDRQLPVAIGHRAVGLVAGSHLLVIDDAGHAPHAERPDAFTDALLSFVRANEAVASG